MSRDQKPGRSKNVAGALPEAVAAAPVAVLTTSSELPATSKTAGEPPVVLLAIVFILASMAGGIGLALSSLPA